MSDFLTVLGFALLLYASYLLYWHLFPSPNIDIYGKYVLISGCDTGYGHALAIHLDKRGFHVFAGVYSRDSKESLATRLSSRATVFYLDITQQKDIDAAFEIVKGKTDVLHALVNNAGIETSGYVDWVSIETMRKIMDTNFFGHAAVTKTFLPLLMVKRGSRVVNLSSVAGYLGAPLMSAYCASKFAFEAFSDCLRREMRSWGLHVSIIEPSYMRTPMIEGHDQTIRKLWSGLPIDVKERWGERFFDSLMSKTVNWFMKHAEDPDKAIRALEHAVINSNPCARYRPGWQSSLFFFPLSMGPTWLADLVLIRAKVPNVLPTGVLKQSKF
jgi:NAD(P)-dependent dehydrogenase (short-subunit alcohol dehydrogenase family)